MNGVIKFLTVCLLTLGIIFSMTNCTQAGSPDSGDGEGDDGNSTAITPSTIFSKIETLELDLPDTLKKNESGRGLSRANIDYVNLNEVNSQAHSQLLQNLTEMEEQATALTTVLDLFRAQINSDLKADTVFESSFKEFDDYNDRTEDRFIRGKYEYDTTGDETYLILKAGLYWSEWYSTQYGTFYVEAKELESDEISGQVNYYLEFYDETADTTTVVQTKIIFNTETGQQDSYHVVDAPDFQGTGIVRILPDASDINNGISINTYFTSEQYGTYMDLGWANDNYGGLKSYGASDWDGDGTTDQDFYTEYFATEGGDAKIIYRKWGSLDPAEIFWHADQARGSIGDLTPAGGINIYDSGLTSVPTAVTMKTVYDSTGDLQLVEIYDGSHDATTIDSATKINTADDLTNEDPDDIWYLAWLAGSENSIQVGDVIYTFVSYDGTWDVVEETWTGVAIYNETITIPEAVTKFGVDGFYIEEMFPLKYVTGSLNGKTIIQYEQADWNDDGILDPEEDWNDNNIADDFIFYIDADNDGEFDDFAQTNESVREAELYSWEWEEWIWNEETEEPEVAPGTRWLFTEDPESIYDGLTYSFTTEKTAIDEKINAIDDNGYINTLTIPTFPVAGETWVKIPKTDFETTE